MTIRSFYKPKPGLTFTVAAASSFTTGTYYADAPCLEESDPVKLEALRFAVKAWQQALKKNVGMPKLLAPCAKIHCDSPAAIACVLPAQRAIVSPGSSSGIDLRTIFMHEVAHLLGVPHIEEDTLMSSVYTGAILNRPTPFAVALARVASAPANR